MFRKQRGRGLSLSPSLLTHEFDSWRIRILKLTFKLQHGGLCVCQRVRRVRRPRRVEELGCSTFRTFDVCSIREYCGLNQSARIIDDLGTLHKGFHNVA